MSIITALPKKSRVWVYQAGRPLTESEAEQVKLHCRDFLPQWQAHGKPLEAKYELLYNQFLVLSVNEEKEEASGCSIDQSVHFIKSLENEIGVSFLDRSLISYKSNGSIQTCSFREIKQLVEQGEITPETLIFNNSVGTVEEFQERWMIPARDSWISKYF